MGANELHYLLEGNPSTGQGLYIGNEIYEPLFGSQLGIAVSFSIPSLGKFRVIASDGVNALYLTATNDLVGWVNTGSGDSHLTITAAQLATLGLSLVPNQRMSAMVFRAMGGAATQNPSRYNVGLIVNGVVLSSGTTTYNRPAGVSNYNTPQIGGWSYRSFGDFHLYELHFLTSSLSYYKASRLFAQDGRFVNPRLSPGLRNSWYDSWYPNQTNTTLGIVRTVAKRTIRAIGVDYTGSSQTKGQRFFNWRGAQNTLLPPAHFKSQQVADYLYDGASNLLPADFISTFGYWSNLPFYNDPTRGLLGPIRHQDGSNRLPSNFNESTVLLLGGNRLRGQSAGVVLSSVVDGARLDSFLLEDNRNNDQTTQVGAGTHDLRFTNLKFLRVFSGNGVGLSYLNFTAAVGVSVLMDSLSISSNVLGQTWASLFDPLTVKPKSIYLNDVTGLTGPVSAWPDTLVTIQSWSGNRPSMTGKVPPLPVSCQNFWLNADFGVLPDNFNQAKDISMPFNRLTGILIANYATNLDWSTATSPNSCQRANTDAGISEDFIDVDLRGHTGVTIPQVRLGGCKIRHFYWPDKAFTISDLRLGGNPALNLHFDTWNSLAKCTTTFVVNNSGQTTSVFPLGTRIIATTIDLTNNAMSTSVVNANMDAFLDNYAGFPTTQSVKFLNLFSGQNDTNGSMSLAGRASRLSELLSKVTANNWGISFKASTVYSGTNLRALTRITFNSVGIINPDTGAPTISVVTTLGIYGNPLGQTITIQDTPGGLYDGDWIIRSHLSSAIVGNANYRWGMYGYNSNLWILESTTGKTFSTIQTGATDFPNPIS